MLSGSWLTDFMKTVYYTDLLHDDFAGNHIKTKAVTELFPYINNNIAWRITAFFLYHFVAYPLIFLYCKILYGMRIVGKDNIAEIKRGGYFIYGNHTHTVDSFIPTILSNPRRKSYIIAGPDSVSIRGFKNIVMMLGAIPLPTTLNGMRKFLTTVINRINGGASVAVYPEAHIWPYYTGIRPFADNSFYYPVKMNIPVIAFCNTYSKRKLLRFIKVPRMTVYVSRPMYPDASLPPKEAQAELKGRVYQFMKQMAGQYSKYEYIRYVQRQTYAEHSINKQTVN